MLGTVCLRPLATVVSHEKDRKSFHSPFPLVILAALAFHKQGCCSYSVAVELSTMVGIVDPGIPFRLTPAIFPYRLKRHNSCRMRNELLEIAIITCDVSCHSVGLLRGGVRVGGWPWPSLRIFDRDPGCRRCEHRDHDDVAGRGSDDWASRQLWDTAQSADLFFSAISSDARGTSNGPIHCHDAWHTRSGGAVGVALLSCHPGHRHAK